MSFDLRVEFTGLCMYVVHADPALEAGPGGELDADEVTVVIPECRFDRADVAHLDGTSGKPHVGYMRLDLATIAGADVQVPASTAGQIPAYEVVHRFDNETLGFGLEDGGPVHVAPALPEFDRFAPGVKPQDALFTKTAAGANPFAAMRATLRGGRLIANPDEAVEQQWEFRDHFGGQGYSGTFAESVVWFREVEDRHSLTLTLTSFGEENPAQHITLHPVIHENGRPTISLKIANLCCENPLEWKELEPGSPVEQDDDFKWFYRAMTPAAGTTFKQMLLDSALDEFPIPVKKGPERGGQGCIGTTVRKP
jgi:hypothetical protein